MENPPEIENKPITYISFNFTAEVGRNDDLVAYLRIVPDGKVGNTVFARVLKKGENDSGEGVIVDRAQGEIMTFINGSIIVSIDSIDNKVFLPGEPYNLVTNLVWTWLHLNAKLRENFSVYLLSTARRLDVSYLLYKDIKELQEKLHAGDLNGIVIRRHIFEIVSKLELFFISVNRAIVMINKANPNFGSKVPVPKILKRIKESITVIRNAYEHLEETAVGKMDGQPDTKAFAFFNLDSFFKNGEIVIDGKKIFFKSNFNTMFPECRQFVKNLMAELSGNEFTVRREVTFFKQ